MKYRILLFACLFISLITRLEGQALKPYLQSATDHSIWVSWRTATGTESTVLWGEAATELIHTATGFHHEFAADYQWHSVKLSGLSPNTAYYYKVVTGTQESPVNRFRTYQSPATANGHIRVLIVGDTQHPTTAQRTFAAAEEKLIEKYGPNIEDNLHLILKQGDNVDAGGVLSQYISMHFDPLSNLSGKVPTMTVVGNHEYYQDSDLSNYFPHFEFDDPDMLYNGIAGEDAEHYYAFRVGSLLFCMFNSNEWWSRQTNWLTDVVAAANNDSSVKWIFGTAHHPLRCENWVSDGSAYIRDQIIPALLNSNKTAMYTSGHSHMYARGSNRDSSVWEVISGGGGLIQNWNQNPEQNYPDVQRSFDVWTYQIMDIDLDAGAMDVECYSIGNNDYVLDNVLIDQFHRYFDRLEPDRPELAPFPDTVSLPFTFEGSAYFSPEGELYNATEFDIADASGDFESGLIINVKRDFEDFFQIVDPDYWSPIDQMVGVNIFELTVDSTQVYEGQNWIRVRYRDQNLEWSQWSEPVSFIAQNGNTPLDLEPIAWWHFNGDAVDATGHGHDGQTPPSGVTFPSDTPVRGQIAQFNNTQSITIRSGPSASEGLPTTQITVSGWVKVNAADTWGGFIGCLQDNGSYEKGWVLGTRNQKFSFALVTANAGFMTYLTDADNFNIGQWYYLTATYNGSTAKLFVDGVLKASTTEQNGDIVYAGLDSDWFGIGSYVDLDENWLHDGALDELIIWERALPDAEVAAWYAQVSNLAPQVSLVTPANNTSYVAPASITVSAEALDIDGSIGVVEFFNGTQKIYEDVDGEPYAFIWENAPAGVHVLTAKATDNMGVSSVSAPVSVIVLVNLAPSINILAPADSSSYVAPAQITIVTHATDFDGQVAKVEFYNGSEKIGEDTDGVPFFLIWEDVPAGEYQLRARAFDNNGSDSYSAPITVFVTTSTATDKPGAIKRLTLAPNPTAGSLTIISDESLEDAIFQVFTLDRRLVFSSRLSGSQVDLGQLPAGTYLIDVQTRKGIRLQGLVVKQ